MMKAKILKIIGLFLCASGAAVTIIGLSLYCVVNAAIIGSVAGYSIAIAVIAAAFIAEFVFGRGKEIASPKTGFIISIITFAVAAAGFALLILFTVGINMFQPLTLSTETALTLFVGMGVTLFGVLFCIFISKERAFAALTASIIIVAICVGVISAFAEDYKDFYNYSDKKIIYENGEDGYGTFRLPSLIALDRKVLKEKQGVNFRADPLMAFAEARKDGSRDIGKIDLVAKVSLDNGVNWSNLVKVVDMGNDNVKVGNPTCVFNKTNGEVILAYMIGKKSEGYAYRTYVSRCVVTQDGGLSILATVELNGGTDVEGSGRGDGVTATTIMVGPGKGVCLDGGRIIIPCSNGGKAYCLISDDGGNTFRRSEPAGEGNENEIAVLTDGSLIMVARDNAKCYTWHGKQYQKFYYSYDKGETWAFDDQNKALKTPICMASIAAKTDGELVFSYPDDFLTRGNLSVATSADNGKNWQVRRLYDGASGYSCVTVNGDDDVFVLAEIGKINYNEALVFIKL